MELQELKDQINKNIEDGNLHNIKSLLSEYHPSEIAEILDNIDPDIHSNILSSLDNETASEVLLELDDEHRQDLLEDLDNERIADIVEEMDSDDAADVIADLADADVAPVLSKLDPEELEEVKTLLQYPEDTAGGIMQTELAEVTDDSTVRDAINWIRLIADEIDDLQDIYVIDDAEKLLGMVSPKKLLLSNPSTKLKNLMVEPEVTVTPLIDQEEVAEIFEKYDIFALPVIDETGKLLGRITADDIIDVITEEASEDMYQLAGVQDQMHPIYTPTITRIKLRTPWLLLTLVGELLIALIIVYAFQPTLEKVAILAAFMPAIMATGGNVGIQTTTIVIRSLGMGTITFSQIYKLVLSEVKVGLSIGVVCGLVAATAGIIIGKGEPQVLKLALAVFIAMMSATMATSFIGAASPLLLQKFKFDPAAASGPFLTMFNDIFGSVVYLFIAMLIF
ncbi:MAG TPA: magnesium transporter [Thermodesulfobacteriota bacterium]|nr:magnesium transporter [Thermodesulfobacteriota bacterium]